MAKLESRLTSALQAAQREALLSAVLDDDKVTVGELASLKGGIGEVARALTIGELRGRGSAPASGRKGRAPAKPGRKASAPKASAAKPARAGKGVDTRTPAGREAYESKLLTVLAGMKKPASAPELRAKCGGSADQARRALNRLIDLGKVNFTGKARGTRYTAA